MECCCNEFLFCKNIIAALELSLVVYFVEPNGVITELCLLHPTG